MHLLVLDAIIPRERDVLLASGKPLDRKGLDPRAVMRSRALERETIREEQPTLDANDVTGSLERS